MSSTGLGRLSSTFAYYTPSPKYATLELRPWLPLEAHPSQLIYPPLPRAVLSRSPSFNENYTVTTHVFPAAYPRSTPYVYPFVLPSESASKTKRKAAINATAKQIVEIREADEAGELRGERDRRTYWCTVNRYARKNAQERSGRPSATLVFAPPAVFPKEIWETTLHNLLDKPHPLIEIDEVWSWEPIQHGDSALLNAGILGGTYGLVDHARDLAQLLLHFIPDFTRDDCVPTHLQRVSQTVSDARIRHGFALDHGTGVFIGIGHSYGGCAMTKVALEFPALFSGLLLIDPAINQPGTYDLGFRFSTVAGALVRRNQWKSRDEARSVVMKSFPRWHASIVSTYITYALIDTDGAGLEGAENQKVGLKTSPYQEALLYANTRILYEVWQELPSLPERIALRFLRPELHEASGVPSVVPEEKAFPERAWRRPANASNTIIKGAEHLVRSVVLLHHFTVLSADCQCTLHTSYTRGV
ncbi:hypothetical protein CONPUDRAFT_169932 [Coniophora puteana RWD-64-598 SS2]|uniref:AB hydrolase-1 domain-containing protein n=1 Tax=Coniophora puteana (strain RWD-64-598) TaxID=741705 RepID=R7SFA3_CONPW|nr:uncharacterized protein CONPUDRAFT_169932 [Coniophora puteana RWD-64-598 SS2]EIW74555.1 hypothetical protein CONPUDRAFT_169932 [Coniophora puteana RWD-64-598 SS2]